MPRRLLDSKTFKRKEQLRQLVSSGAAPELNVRAPPRSREAIEALNRMADGTYGFCADCGCKIPEARLRAKPEATRCVNCQEKQDQLSAA